MKKFSIRQIVIAAVVIAGIAALYFASIERPARKVHPRDYAEIAAEGTLRAVMEYNALGLYADKDTVAGFYYELVEAFARDHHIEVEVYPEMDISKRLQGISDGTFDLVANGIPSTSELKDTLLLTEPLILNRLVLVQRKPVTAEDSAKYIKSQLDLAGQTVYITKAISTAKRLQNLGDEIGDTIYVKELERYGNEQLLALVAHGDINYAVCEENLARIVSDSLQQIDLSTPVSFTQFYSWAVNKKSPALLDSLNVWILRFKQTREYRQLIDKYL